MAILILALAEGAVDAAVAAMTGEPAQPVSIHGSDSGVPCANVHSLHNALMDLRDTLRPVPNLLLAVADAPGRGLWRQLLARQDAWLPLHWELRRFEALAVLPDVLTTPGRRAPSLAPWLLASGRDEALEAMRQAQQQAMAADAAHWQEERARLLAEVEALRQQRDALRKADAERLAAYLPALYEHVFAVVAPTDLALLCRTLTPPAVPNPWPEPAPETVRKLQADFRALPEAAQRELVAFAQSLPQAAQLKPRAEMRELIAMLEGQP